MPLFHGWKVVAAAFIILFTAYGAQYSFGVFFNALLQEFHWSRATLEKHLREFVENLETSPNKADPSCDPLPRNESEPWGRRVLQTHRDGAHV